MEKPDAVNKLKQALLVAIDAQKRKIDTKRIKREEHGGNEDEEIEEVRPPRDGVRVRYRANGVRGTRDG